MDRNVTSQELSVEVASSVEGGAVNAVQLAYTATYVVPEAAIQYILLSVDPKVDEKGLDKFFFDQVLDIDAFATVSFTKRLVDSFGTADAKVISFTKRPADIANAVDVPFKGVSKPITDTVGRTDTATIGFGKAAVDTITTSETQVFGVAKVLADFITPVDSLAAIHFSDTATDGVAIEDLNIDDDPEIAIGKIVSDTFTQADVAAVGFEKPASELVSFADVSAVGFEKPAEETFTANDTPSLGVGLVFDEEYVEVDYFASDYVRAIAVIDQVQLIDVGKLITDTAPMTEFTAFELEKVLDETQLVTDLCAVGFQTAITETTTASDTRGPMAVGKALADTPIVTDSGVLAMTDYVVANYFASDFVGINRSL